MRIFTHAVPFTMIRAGGFSDGAMPMTWCKNEQRKGVRSICAISVIQWIKNVIADATMKKISGFQNTAIQDAKPASMLSGRTD